MRVLLLAICSSLVACASQSTTPPDFRGRVVHSQLHRLMDVCERMNQHAYQETQGVQCQIWNLNRLHLKFPDQASYQQVDKAIAQMVQTWCGTATELSNGAEAYYSWEFTKERSAFSRHCSLHAKEKS